MIAGSRHRVGYHSVGMKPLGLRAHLLGAAFRSIPHRIDPEFAAYRLAPSSDTATASGMAPKNDWPGSACRKASPGASPVPIPAPLPRHRIARACTTFSGPGSASSRSGENSARCRAKAQQRQTLHHLAALQVQFSQPPTVHKTPRAARPCGDHRDGIRRRTTGPLDRSKRFRVSRSPRPAAARRRSTRSRPESSPRRRRPSPP